MNNVVLKKLSIRKKYINRIISIIFEYNIKMKTNVLLAYLGNPYMYDIIFSNYIDKGAEVVILDVPALRLYINSLIYKYKKNFSVRFISIKKDTLENIKVITNNMPKFDYIIQNPPYSGDLHIKFLKHILDNLRKDDSKIISIEPASWLISLKDDGKYTRKNSDSVYIKDKYGKYIQKVVIKNFNNEFGIENKTPLSITWFDFSKESNIIDFTNVLYSRNVNSIYDCNLIGDYNDVISILQKCKVYKDHMINHCINTKLHNTYKNCWFLRYGNYMLHNLGTMVTHSLTSSYVRYTPVLNTFSTYFTVAEEDKPIVNSVPLSKSGNPCDSVYGTKKELENWKYFCEHNKIVVFINICLTIDENNNSREYLPWLVDKKYTDDEIYEILGITKKEQKLIDNVISRFDLNSDWLKNYIFGNKNA